MPPRFLRRALGWEACLLHEVHGIDELLVAELELAARCRVGVDLPVKSLGNTAKRRETHAEAHPRLGRCVAGVQGQVHGGRVQHASSEMIQENPGSGERNQSSTG